MVVRFKLEPIFATALAASKNEARVKRGQNCLKNNWLVNNDLNPWNSLYLSVASLQHFDDGYNQMKLLKNALQCCKNRMKVNVTNQVYI